ncbi:hypothetical protein [Shewanella algae]|uniref:Uncharacterized protein n=1 Tax=bacterium 19NY03SH02 TaxID=2920631 RepID=A0AAU6UXL3_UNCXX
MEVTEFWSTLNTELLIEIMGVCFSSFAIGYATGLKWWSLRRFAHAAT